ncbi:MAG TPA: adenine phosphoribosyltransferase [Chloroflexi bacterium]|nr:adenine phosphoribosyltransferase [Chloroflexota bacterium]HBY06571.1 adenine phosphoribosyltransferase [Chloroflexota bacterium]
MKDYLKLIDTNTSGPRCDVTPLFTDSEAFLKLVADLSAPFSSLEFEYVAGIDALGFILGTALALYLQKRFIPIRKGGKLPVPVVSRQFSDYTGELKTLELRTDLLKPGDRILLVDEWIETGTQAKAAVELLEELQATVIGIATINIDQNPQTLKLQDDYFCFALWHDGV